MRGINDACTIIDQAQAEAYRAVDITLIKRNWLLGMRINKDVLKEQRAEYGKQVVKNLSLSLIERYGRGFSMRNLYNFVDFYQSHPDIFHAMSGESEFTDILQSLTAKSLIKEKHLTNILQTLTAKSPIRLTWSHYAIILQESSKEDRDWYEQEAAREMWGTRTLQRNVSSQYYHRLLKSQNKALVHDEMVKLTSPLQDRLEHLKNPVVAEFLGFKNRTDYTESKLEQTIIDHLIPFLMEMGKGFALVDRQKRIHTEKEDYYIDMVFYNYNVTHIKGAEGSGTSSPTEEDLPRIGLALNGTNCMYY